MPGNKSSSRLPTPWKEFLTEIDEALTEPLVLHCIGGFAFAHHYGLPRSTGDIDYYTAIPANLNLEGVAGEGSALHRKYGIFLQRVAVMSLPEDYETRLKEMAPDQFKNLKLLVPDPYDCILSKLERNSQKDRDDAEYLFRSRKLEARVLQERYEKELRHNLIGPLDRHDRTLKMWIEVFQTP